MDEETIKVWFSANPKDIKVFAHMGGVFPGTPDKLTISKPGSAELRDLSFTGLEANPGFDADGKEVVILTGSTTLKGGQKAVAVVEVAASGGTGTVRYSVVKEGPVGLASGAARGQGFCSVTPATPAAN